MRHTEVDFAWSVRCSSGEFDLECGAYDSSPIKGTVRRKSRARYERIYISELSRSRDTAEIVFPDEDYIRSGLINEVPLRSSFDTRRKVPLWFWNVSGRFQWFINSSRQAEGHRQTIERARRFVEMICKENADCAVITHGFFMHTLIKEMKRAGFKTNHSSVKYKNGEYVTAEKQGILSKYYDTRVERSKIELCLHKRNFDLGTRPNMRK